MATYSGTGKSSARRQAVIAIGAVLAIGAGVGLGSWQVGLHEGGGRSATKRVQTQMQLPIATQADTLLSATTAGSVSPRERVLYLVNSDADVAALSAGLGYMT